jgi:hypothetical protein
MYNKNMSNTTTQHEALIPITCGRCGGTGRCGPHNVYNGICFQCGGDRIVGYTTQAEIDRKARDAAKRQERREKAAAKKAAKFNTVLESDPELAEAFVATAGIAISDDIRRQGARKGEISDKQRALILKIAADDKAREEKKRARAAAEIERKATLTDLTPGRQEIEGVVISTKHYETAYGLQCKMLVQMDNGNRVFGTLPLSLIEGDCKVVDRRVAFTAKVEPKEKGFGFYSRPTKARFV